MAVGVEVAEVSVVVALQVSHRVIILISNQLSPTTIEAVVVMAESEGIRVRFRTLIFRLPTDRSKTLCKPPPSIRSFPVVMDIILGSQPSDPEGETRYGGVFEFRLESQISRPYFITRPVPPLLIKPVEMGLMTVQKIGIVMFGSTLIFLNFIPGTPVPFLSMSMVLTKRRFSTSPVMEELTLTLVFKSLIV